MADTPPPPQNLDAEESVLGAMMLNDRVIAAVTGQTDLTADDFYRPSHAEIYRAILSLYAKGDPVDAITVVGELERTTKLKEAGGSERVHELAMLVPAASNAAHYAFLVVETAKLRRVQAVAREVFSLTKGGGEPDAIIAQAEEAVFKLAQGARRRGDWVDMPTAVTETHARITAAYEAGRRLTGLAFGHDKFDRLTSGLQPGNLVVIAARPSMGKSSFALGGILECAIFGERQPVGMFNLEMSVTELTQRMISMLAFVDVTDIRNGRLDGEQWSSVMNASQKLHSAPIFIDTSIATMIEVRAKARALKIREPNLAMIVVDYLQLLGYGEGRYEGRVQDVSQISRALKMLAAELEVPVVALSQLSRTVEQRHDKRPILSDLRESGAIEQDADVVVFIYRDEYYNPEDTDQQGIAEINVAKQRNGPTGTVKLAFVNRYARFADLPPD